MRPSSIILLVGGVLVSAYAYAGYSHLKKGPATPDGDIYFNKAASNYDTANPTTAEEHAIANARAFAEAVVQYCTGQIAAGGRVELEDALQAFEQAVDENRFCAEGESEFGEDYLATASNEPPYDNAPTGDTLEYGTPNGDAPGVNVGDNCFPPGVDPASPAYTAVLAAVLMHESAHLAGNHAKGDPDAECEAYSLEAEFICCAISYAGTLDPAIGSKIISALCKRMQVVGNQYYCYYGCSGTLDSCGCSLLSLCGFTAQPGALVPGSSVPRSAIDPCSRRISWKYYTSSLGTFLLELVPCTGKLGITLFSTNSSDYWEFDLTSPSEGPFIPLTLELGREGEVFIAGRFSNTSQAGIYQIDLGWSAGAPTYSSQLLYSGNAFGDILALEYARALNNTLVVFDYSNASLHYFNLTSGNIISVADSTTFPDLLDMLSMSIRKTHWGVPLELALAIVLQPEEVMVTGFHNDQVKTLLFVDRAGDGLVDHSEVIWF